MNKRNLNIFLVGLSLAMLTSFVACNLLITEEPMIFTGNPESEFLGIPWGCHFEKLQELLDESPFPTKFKKVDCHPSMTTYQYRGNHRLPDAKYSAFIFWKGKLVDIGVFFFTESENDAKYLFDKLKEKLKKELEKVVLDRVVGIEDEEKNGVRIIHGTRGHMSFSLEYGGHLIDGSSNSVILSAKTSITLKDE